MTEFRRFAEQQRQERELADVLSNARMMDARGEQPGPFGSDGNELAQPPGPNASLISKPLGGSSSQGLKMSKPMASIPPSNYVHLDPWRPPTPVRRLKPRRDGCEFCCDPELKAVLASLWDLPVAT